MVIDCAHYKQGVRLNEAALGLDEASTCVRGDDEFVWLGVHDPAPELLAEIQRRFDLHDLAIEDAARAHQRPKLEDYEGHYFVVLKTAHYDQEREEVEFGEIHIFLSASFVIVVRHGIGSELGPARKRMEARPDLLAEGPAAAFWAIIDKVVDDYEPVVEGIDEDIEEVEEDVFDDANPAPTKRIYGLKREVLEFHRATFPLLGPLEVLERGAFEQVSEELRRHFRDVADHARRVDEQVSSQRELLTSVLEANLALVSVNQNNVIKQISSYAAIIAVPTYIASVYGMNFEHMPELSSRIGYPLSLLVMGLSVIALTRFFKRIGWL
ncbi:MAG: magnesium/cobalt transporter CorA [Solirubrobacterales bacterium]|nr:magnesium/cobalt transporter CorA [Solirubrobacterales bacterium]